MHEQWLTAEQVLNEGHYWYWGKFYTRPEIIWITRENHGELWGNDGHINWNLEDCKHGRYLPVQFPEPPTSHTPPAASDAGQ